MPYYMLQASYKDEQIKALTQTPQDRSVQASAVIEAHGGKLREFYFAFGDYDIVAISEFPDNESATAAVLTVVSTGGFSAFKTTVLISADEAKRAMKNAGSTKSGYKAPKSN
jgi:uncharacterized protein with GYD domain